MLGVTTLAARRMLWTKFWERRLQPGSVLVYRLFYPISSEENIMIDTAFIDIIAYVFTYNENTSFLQLRTYIETKPITDWSIWMT